MSIADHRVRTDRAQGAAKERRPVAPEFKPIGISSVKAAAEQMRRVNAPKASFDPPPVLRNDHWAA